MNIQEPKLQKAGKGLPLIEWGLSRFIFLPRTLKHISSAQAVQIHQDCGNKALHIANSLTTKQQTKRILIKRIRGIEDSSRCWSAAMTIDHLLIVGTAMTNIIESLAHQRSVEINIKVEDAKPDPNRLPVQVFIEYQKYLDTYPAKINALTSLDNNAYTHKHPWFWNMTASEWLILNALHNRIHLKQMIKIAEKL